MSADLTDGTRIEAIDQREHSPEIEERSSRPPISDLRGLCGEYLH